MRIQLKPLPPEDALRYFEAKGYRLERSFAWQEVWQQQHAAAFTVAKSAGFDILGDIHAAVEDAIREGTTFEAFKDRLKPLLQTKGWWGRRPVTDPVTGQPVEAQLGSPRRLRIIFDTNLRMSYAAGSWARIERTKAARPYLRYVAVKDSRTRPEHLGWHGTVLPVEHDWWKTHTPPNGWRCRCSVQSLSRHEMERQGLVGTPAPPLDERPWQNPRTGETVRVPAGIDPGFGYHPGLAAMEVHAAQLFYDRLAGLPPGVTAAASAASARFLLPQLGRAFAGWVKQLTAEIATGAARGRGDRHVVGALSKPILEALEARGLPPMSGAISISDRDILHMLRAAKAARGQAVPPELLPLLPRILAQPEAILWDRQKRNLVYVYAPGETPNATKLIVVVNRSEKLPPSEGKHRRGVITNSIVTTGLVKLENLRDGSFYELIEGKL